MLLWDVELLLDADQHDRLLLATDDLVVLDPTFLELEDLAPGIAQAGAADGDLRRRLRPGRGREGGDGGCRRVGLPHRRRAADATGCLADDDRYARLVQTGHDGATVTVLGLTEVLTNGEIAKAGNAALALNLLGAHETLVWYIPGADDLSDQAPLSIGDLTPPWVTPFAVMLVLVALGAVFWRARRVGPLVVENLPVVVRASETMEGRARLYERSDSRLHALDALRIGTVARLARSCGLPRTATVGEVVDAVAALTGRDRGAVADILIDHAPSTDAELVHLSDQLLRLESETAPSAADQNGRHDRDSSSLRDSFARVRTEVGKSVVGQDGAVTGLLIALLAGGHVLLEGVPGVAKTLLVRTLSRTLNLDTKRVQFTPDLMPGDITGSVVYDPKSGEFEFREGPVFTNLLLADEINRTPPKTQSALLEAMEERQVSADGVTRAAARAVPGGRDDEPDRVRGHLHAARGAARPLPAQARARPAGARRRDRGGHPARRTASTRAISRRPASARCSTRRRSPLAQKDVATVTVSPDVLGYAVDLARGTRQSPSVKLGVSPRGTTALLAASRAWAWLTGSAGVTPDHVQAMAVPVMRHRIQLRPEAELEGVAPDAVLRSIMQQVQVPI